MSPTTPSGPASVSSSTLPGSPTSTFAASSGYDTRAAAARNASAPSSKSWLPTQAAAMGSSATSPQGRSPSSTNDGCPTTRSPSSSHTVGRFSDDLSKSSRTPATDPDRP